MISLTSTVYPKQSHAIVQIAITVTLFSEFCDVYCWLAKGQMCDVANVRPSLVISLKLSKIDR